MAAQHAFLRSIALQRHLRCSQHQNFALLIATASVSAAFFGCSDAKNNWHEKLMHHQRTMPPSQLCKCEESDRTTAAHLPTAIEKSAEPISLSRLTLMLYASKLYRYSHLPVPRLITPRDPLFSYPELKRGLNRRRKDEEKVKRILSSPELIEARKNQDQAQMQNILRQMNLVVYGEGITPQIREDFLMQYGCTGFTDEILQYLVQRYGSRGIIEVGAGNGQWARALSDRYHELKQQHQIKNNSKSSKSWEFILAFDNMEQLPLSPKVYHENTLPANKYFFDKVQQSSHIDAVQQSRGRVLLLVYPPPGPMALETVQAYLNTSLGYGGSFKNDTIVYVGEGRGGANADEAFFDYFLGSNRTKEDTGESQWVLEKVMDVHQCPGGKGYEKMFEFRRRSIC